MWAQIQLTNELGHFLILIKEKIKQELMNFLQLIRTDFN